MNLTPTNERSFTLWRVVTTGGKLGIGQWNVGDPPDDDLYGYEVVNTVAVDSCPHCAGRRTVQTEDERYPNRRVPCPYCVTSTGNEGGS